MEEKNEQTPSRVLTDLRTFKDDRVAWQWLAGFVDSKNRFNPVLQDQNGMTEFMMIVSCLGPKGAKLFLENGGQLNAKAQDRDGWTELMWLLDKTPIDMQPSPDMSVTFSFTTETLQLFFENGGHLNPEAIDTWGTTEFMMIVPMTGLEGTKLFLEQGGRFNPQARDICGQTEAMKIAIYTGIEGLEWFVENGGQFSPLDRDNGQHDMLSYIEREGDKAVQRYNTLLKQLPPINPPHASRPPRNTP